MSPRFCRFHAIGPRVAVLIFSAVSCFAVSTVNDAPTAAPAPIVDQPLTPAANDSPGEQPTPQHTWVPGHWRWLEGAYVWEAGRWEVPPAANVAWNPPQWQQQGNGYVLREGYWDEAPPPAPAMPANEGEIATAEPPPPPKREPIAERPMGMTVWLPGYWTWREGRHVWVAGYWTNPPRRNAQWVQARWEQRAPNRYVFISGYWRDNAVPTPMPEPAAPVAMVPTTPPPQVVVTAPTPPPQQVIVLAPPPSPRHEVIYGRPSPYHVWVPGYWAWRSGRHVWMAGHWEQPPRGYRSWREPRWERRGGSHIFIEGQWSR